MGDSVLIETLKELRKIYGTKFEIVIRNVTNGRIKQIDKICIDKLIKEAKKNEETIKRLKNMQKNFAGIKNLKHITLFNSVIGVANLCATTIGFEMVMNELDKISKKIEENKELMQTINETFVFDKFQRVLSDHMAMLDGRKGGVPFGETEYRKLIDDEYATLSLLYKTIINQSCVNKLEVLQAIVGLAEMMSQTIFFYDSIYYFNHEKVGDFYSGQKSWLSIYNLLTSDSFNDYLQDLFFLEKGYHQDDVDYLTSELNNGFKENLDRVLRNDEVIKNAKTIENYNLFLNYIDIKTMEEIDNHLNENGITDEEVVEMFHAVCKEQSVMCQG